MGRASKGPLAAVAAVLILGAASIAAVDLYRSESADLPAAPRSPQEAEHAEPPRLPRTNVQSETIGAFTARLPQGVAAGVTMPTASAPAYALRTARTTAAAVELRDALGLTGEPEVDDAGVIVDDTSSDRVLRVVFAPGNPWMMYRGEADCLKRADAGVSVDGRIFCQTERGSSRDPGPLSPRTVDADGARDIAESLVRELGLTAHNLSVSDDDYGFGLGRGWGVTVELSVGGLPAIGLDIRLAVAEAGRMTSGFGMLPEPERVGEFPLIDVAAAHQRLLEFFESAEPGGQVGSRLGTGPDRESTAVVGVRLALALSEPPQAGSTPREVSYLAPTWVLDVSDGAVFPVPAVTEEHLAAKN